MSLIFQPLSETPYAFTCRKVKDPHLSTVKVIEEHLSKLVQLGLEIRDQRYENTSGLHCHGIMIIPYKFNMKRLRIRGWHLYVRPIVDMEGWIRYINKDIEDTIGDEDGLKIPSRSLFKIEGTSKHICGDCINKLDFQDTRLT